jgi:hypothetical protein
MKLEVPHVTICSVEPIERHEFKIMTAPTEQNPTMNAMRTEFILLPADPKKGWSICKVYDGVQFASRYDLGSAPDKPQAPPTTVLARDTANWLVNKWQERSLNLKFPRGVMIIEGDVPTAEELRTLNTMATQRMRAMVQAVDLAVNAGNNLDFVTKEHVDAANVLGEVREWAREERRQKKICPRCAGIVEAAAIACINCGADFGEFYEEQGYLPEEIKALDQYAYDALVAKKTRLSRKVVPAKA